MNEKEIKMESTIEASTSIDIDEGESLYSEAEENALSAATAEATSKAADAGETAEAGAEAAETSAEYHGEIAEMPPFVPEAVKASKFISPSDVISGIAEERAAEQIYEKEESEHIYENFDADGEPDTEAAGDEGERCDTAEEMLESGYSEKWDAPLSEELTRSVVTNPMFALFARGKSQSFDDICRDFLKMTSGTKYAGSRRMITPSGMSAVNRGVELSDRQRKLAREYGMSYREYYELINGIPSK